MKNRETFRREYEQIETLLAEGKKVPEIARLLGVSPSVVYHRLSRHRGPKPETKVVWVRLPLAIHAALLQTASANRRAMAIEAAFLIERALQAYAAPSSAAPRPGRSVPPASLPEPLFQYPFKDGSPGELCGGAVFHFSDLHIWNTCRPENVKRGGLPGGPGDAHAALDL